MCAIALCDHITKRILCDNFELGQTVVLDLTKSCLIYDNAAHLFVPYLKSSVCPCPGAVTPDTSGDGHAYIDAAFSFVSRQRTTTAKVVVFLDPSIDCKDYVLKASHITSPLAVLSLSTPKPNLEKWIQNISLVATPIYFVVIGKSEQISLLLDSSSSVPQSDLYHWTIVVSDDVTSNWESYHWQHLVVFRHSQKKSPSVLSDYLQQIQELTKIHTLNNSAATSLCAQDNINSSYGTQEPDIQIYGTVYSPPEITLNIFCLDRTKNGNVTVKKIGEWKRRSGLNMTISPNMHDNSNRLRVVTKHEPPFVFRNQTGDTTVFTGYAIDTFDIVAKRLGVEYTLYEVEDNQYGAKKPDGTWSGIIGDLVSGSADVAVAALPMTTERENVIDMTTPFYEFGGIQIVMKGSQTEPSLMAFTTVFSGAVWACYAALLVVCGVLIFVCERFSPYAPARLTDWTKFTVSEGLWFVAVSFTQTGPESIPQTFSARILIAGFWFFCSIMMATYTANLAAYLTTSRMTIPIESLDDLASQRTVQYSVVAGTSIHAYFERMATIEMNFYELWKNMTSNARQKDLTSTLANFAVWDYPLGEKYVAIWQTISKTGLLNSTQAGINRVLKGNFAFIHEYPLLQYELLKHCGLVSVGKQFSSKPYAFALPHSSPFTKKISQIILELQGETILENLKSKWWNTSSLLCPTIDESKGLTFHTLGGIFILVAAGVTVGLIFFGLELAWSKIRRKKMKEHFKVDGPPNSRTNLALAFQSDNISECGEGTSYQQTPV
ncbi:ionotropic receptor 25a-like [Gigantopelta aegis]|uniref:ionotropic receptor 25a-like n=1 Tax=Gigantopelta aegis TaxID=1735272 RepID=UPI001B889830|nr:ionotropic receptor 25a-like [Gigantopelta aegis]